MIRFEGSYQRLYGSVVHSMSHCAEISEEIIRIENSTIYKTKILPILDENRRLAERERKILTTYLDRSWQRFDERLEKEIHVRNEIEQLNTELRTLKKKLFDQEENRSRSVKIEQIQQKIDSIRKG